MNDLFLSAGSFHDVHNMDDQHEESMVPMLTESPEVSEQQQGTATKKYI